MSKLSKSHGFLDVSDFGRPLARIIANAIKSTNITPIHVTLTFTISGLVGIYFIVIQYFWLAAFFLILKSILDAADGELARIKNTPSYTGRYLDSIADILLNLGILIAIGFISNTNHILTLIAFLGIQLQGTLYNYYYVILRNKFEGDTTSRVFEIDTPIALEGENQRTVNFYFSLYKLLYGIFDRMIFLLDKQAPNSSKIPNWLMSLVSIFGLGFQLLIISVMLVAGWKDYIIAFFIAYTALVIVFIGLRKLL